MTRRYFAAPLPPCGGVVKLDADETHHLTKVMRVKVGETVTLFDGEGRQCDATVESIGRRDVICLSQPPAPTDHENARSLTLGIAMPKGDRSKDLIERLTELGVNRVVPLHCNRTQWPVTENAITKWQRVVIDACKQSGRNHLMEIAPPVRAAQWFGDSAHVENVMRIIADPSGAPSLGSPEARPLACAIGPEGGFDAMEMDAAKQLGWHPVSFGSRILRIETASIVAAIKLVM